MGAHWQTVFGTLTQNILYDLTLVTKTVLTSLLL